jgi:hypothetical protein
MGGKNWRVSVLACLCGLVLLCGSRAAEVKPTDEGKVKVGKE